MSEDPTGLGALVDLIHNEIAAGRHGLRLMPNFPRATAVPTGHCTKWVDATAVLANNPSLRQVVDQAFHPSVTADPSTSPDQTLGDGSTWSERYINGHWWARKWMHTGGRVLSPSYYVCPSTDLFVPVHKISSALPAHGAPAFRR